MGVRANLAGGGASPILTGRSHACSARYRYPLINFGIENHEKYTVVYSNNRLMIPLYQANPHNDSVRKNVRSLAVVSMLLGLLYELGLDLLSSGNLVEVISGVSRWWVQKD